MKQLDNWGNPTYVRDDVGFLVVNFRHKVPKMLDPFIFPNQATQFFGERKWADRDGELCWQRRHAQEDMKNAQHMFSLLLAHK